MLLAKAARTNPRALAQALVAALPRHDDVAKVEIAGPGFINFHLAPAAYQREVREIVAAQGDAYGRNDQRRGPHGRRGIRVRQSHRPAARRPRPRRGDRRLHRARAGRQRLERDARVLLQRRRRADRQPRQVGAGARAGQDAGRRRLAGGRLSRRLHRRRGQRLPARRHRRVRGPHRHRRPRIPTTSTPIRRFAVACLRREQNADLAAFGVSFDVYFLESRCTPRARSRRPCASWSPTATPTRKAARCGCAPPTSATTRTA